MTRAHPVLVVGGPRMGTTWVAATLSQAGGVAWINEPDNEWPDTFALRAKLSLGRFPVLGAQDRAPAEYEVLWERALAGYRQSGPLMVLADRLEDRRRTRRDLWRAMCDHAHPRVAPWLRVLAALSRAPRRRTGAAVVLVKSVHAPLAVEWVAARFRPRVVLVLRHPLNVVASWIALGWGGCALDTNPLVRERFGRAWALPELPPGRSALAAVAWEVALYTTALRAAASRHPDWIVVEHEALCVDPGPGFAELARRAGLPWDERGARFLEDTNRPGTGYAIARVAAEQPERWRHRLTPDQVREAWSVFSRIRAPWVEQLQADLG